MIHPANGTPIETVWTEPFLAALDQLGDLTTVEWASELSEDELARQVRDHDVAIVGWDTRQLPAQLAGDPGNLRFVCSYSGTIRHSVPVELIEAGLWVSNWGDHPASGVAEGALTLLLAVLKEIPAAHTVQRNTVDAPWGIPEAAYQRQAHLGRCRLGIYGMGAIGRHLADLVRPFGCEILAFDPYVTELPESCERVETLDELFDRSHIVVIHAGLSDETEGSVDAEMLARLPDGGVIVNTARGAIIDQGALVAEIESGRLRAGLDVLEPDLTMPADHPFRRLDNVLLTWHQVEAQGDTWPPHDGLTALQKRCVDNLRRFADGETPEWLFDLDRYHRST